MLSFLYVYSHHSILECYNLFSGVELSMRSFFVFSLFRVFVFQPFKMLGNTGMVGTATKFLYLEDES